MFIDLKVIKIKLQIQHMFIDLLIDRQKQIKLIKVNNNNIRDQQQQTIKQEGIKMKQANVAVESLGAKIKTYSSCIDSLHEPTNILQASESTLWATGQGIPQFVIVSLEDLTIKFKSVTQVGFMLWHDYDTNPKEIELWVAETTEEQFVFWARFELQQKKGIQLYEIKPLPAQYIYLKISITQTYGAFQTYLNQVFFMAQGIKQRPKTTTKQIMPKQKKQLNLKDLQSDLKQLQQMDRKISRSKSNKKQQKKLNKMSRNSELSKRQRALGYEATRNKQKLIKERQSKHPFRAEISQGSLSSHNKPGRSIYFRSQDYYQNQQQDSHQIVSNDYQSSSSNNNHNPHHYNEKHKPKVSSQESEEFSHSLQSNNTAMSPSLNMTNTLSQKDKFFSRQVGQRHEKEEDNRRSYKRLIEREKGQHNNSKKKTKEYSYDGDEPQYSSSKRKPNKHGIQEEEQNEDQEQLGPQQQQQMQESQAEQFTNNFIDKTPHYNQVSGQQQQQQQQEQLQGSSIPQQQQQPSQQSQDPINYNAAIMALSKHVIKIQDNMQAIQRKVQVLDLKVTHSHHKIQQSIMHKVSNQVQQIVDRKLSKIWSLNNIHLINKLNNHNSQHNTHSHQQQNPKQRKTNTKQSQQQGDNYNDNNKLKNEQQFNYKKNLTKQFFNSDKEFSKSGKDFFKSDYYAQQQNMAQMRDYMAQMRDRTKTKRTKKETNIHQNNNISKREPYNYSQEKILEERRLKGSKSFTNMTYNRNLKDKDNKQRNQKTIENNKLTNNNNNQQLPNQQYIANLLQRLNTKLKERQLKLNKIQRKSKQHKLINKQDSKDKRKTYGLKERQHNKRQPCNELYNNHYS